MLTMLTSSVTGCLLHCLALPTGYDKQKESTNNSLLGGRDGRQRQGALTFLMAVKCWYLSNTEATSLASMDHLPTHSCLLASLCCAEAAGSR